MSVLSKMADALAGGGELAAKYGDDVARASRLSKRLSGDALSDAEDMVQTLRNVGADIDDDGIVTLYHRTSPNKLDLIQQSGIMKTKEPGRGVYFSTNKNAGSSLGYGDSVLTARIPVEKLQLDDIFSDNADVVLPTFGQDQINVRNYIGDGANASNSVLERARKLGMEVTPQQRLVLNTDILDTDAGVDSVKDFLREYLGEDTQNYKRALEQIGAGEYQMAHRPWKVFNEDESGIGSNLANIETDILPKAYGANRQETINNLSRNFGAMPDSVKRQSIETIADYQGRPDDLVTIYRQSPKDLNYGDWVALNEDYANAHIGNSPQNKLWKKQVPAKEVFFAGDDLNEWGYFPKQVEFDPEITSALAKILGL